MWNEQDHPRDDEGKFTFKNGGVSSSENVYKQAAEIFYSKTKKDQERKDKRGELIQKLGDKLTDTQVLYATNEELEKMLKKQGQITGMEPQITYNDEIKKILGLTDLNQTKEIKFSRPTGGRITSNFGPRDVKVGSKYHKGVDIGVPKGTPVKPIAGGKVYMVGNIGDYGIAVYIDHGIINGKKVTSEYGHLSSYNVKVGDRVEPGQVVAKSGNTGRSSGPHLHLTIRENGKEVDPRKYIKF